VRPTRAGIATQQTRDSAVKWQFNGEDAMMEMRYAVCVRNDGYPAALELHRLYRMFPDDADLRLRMIRVEDESGESYLYPRDFFHPVDRAPVKTELPANADLRFVLRKGGEDEDVDWSFDRLFTVLPDAMAAEDGWIRVVDDSGEDYLYPETLFRPVDVPAGLRQEMLLKR
jgi:hypothetical protein